MGWVVGWMAGGPYLLSRRRYLLGKLESGWTRKIVGFKGTLRAHFISHASKVMLKLLQARLQQYVNRELPDVQAGFRKGRGTRDQIANIRWTIEKAKEFQKKKHLFLLH